MIAIMSNGLDGPARCAATSGAATRGIRYDCYNMIVMCLSLSLYIYIYICMLLMLLHNVIISII